LWELRQVQGGDGDRGIEGEMVDQNLRRRNVVAVERDPGFTDG